MLTVPKDINKSSKDPQDSEWNIKESNEQTSGKLILDNDFDGKISPSKL